MKETLKVTIYFSESKTDSCWEGMVEKKVKLENQEEIRIKVNYIVMRNGIYEISNELKYTIEN